MIDISGKLLDVIKIYIVKKSLLWRWPQDLRVFKNYLPIKTKDAYFIDNVTHSSRIVICMTFDC